MAHALGKIPTTSVRRLISLLSRSIAWSQYTFWTRAAAQRDYVADLHVLAVVDDSIDQEFDERTALVEVGMFETCTDRLAEVFDAHSDGLQMVARHGFGVDHVLLVYDLCETLFTLRAPLLELLERECLCLVRIHQTLDARLKLSVTPSKVAPVCLALFAT
jgi:hypothetical protein